jgi:hypothetical protein
MPKSTPKAAPKSTTKKLSKAGFVRSLPSDTPAKVVVAKAKAMGLTLSEPYVYNVRATTKRRGGSTSRGATNGTLRASGHATEDLLRAVAAELGLTRAIGVLRAEHERVHRLLGG